MKISEVQFNTFVTGGAGEGKVSFTLNNSNEHKQALNASR